MPTAGIAGGGSAAVVAGALLVLAPFIVLGVFARSRVLRWDVVVVGAVAFVVAEPFQILCLSLWHGATWPRVPLVAAFWQGLAAYVPFAVYGIRERDEAVTLGIAFGGAGVVTVGLDQLTRAAAALAGGGAIAGGGAGAMAVLATLAAQGAAMWAAVGMTLFAAEAARSRRLRWVAAAMGLNLLGDAAFFGSAVGPLAALAGAILIWWLANRLPVAGLRAEGAG